MDFPIFEGRIELGQRGRRRVLKGSFPYNQPAVESDRARTRKSVVKPGAFQFALESPEHEVNLLKGHSFDFVIASKRAGSLQLKDTPDALLFETELPIGADQPTWLLDMTKELDNGMHVYGISPGFVVPPLSAVAKPSELIQEEGTGVLIEQFLDVRLFELSIVARPKFSGTRVELNDQKRIVSATPTLERWGHLAWL